MTASNSSTESDAPIRRVLYFADPMCSWCWGFAPVIWDIHAMIGDWAPIGLILGGLRTGTRQPMRDKDKAAIRHHWEAVHEETGQPFAFSFFDREDFVYDTEPACRAVVAVRNLRPDRSLDYLEAVQRAFYAEDRDVTQVETLADIAGNFGVPAETLTRAFSDPSLAAATHADFALTQSAGISGFPTIILQQDDEVAPLAMGYQPFAALKPHLEAWMKASSSVSAH